MRIIQAKDAYLSNYHNEEVREFFELFQDVHLMNRKELYEKYKDRELKSAEAVETVAVLGRCEKLKDLITVKQGGQKVCKNFDRIVKEWEEEAKAKGLAEGLAEGHANGYQEGSDAAKRLEKLTTIDRLCKIGAELSLIAVASGLSVMEVEKIIQENQFCQC